MTPLGQRIIIFVSLGFVAIGVALKWPALGNTGRGLFILAGGWFLAAGSFYQMRQYAEEKDIFYYLMFVFASVIGLGMLAITGFWLWTLF